MSLLLTRLMAESPSIASGLRPVARGTNHGTELKFSAPFPQPLGRVAELEIGLIIKGC